MARVNATDAKNRFGQLLEMAKVEPVHVQKNGRDVGVVISPEQYERLLELSSAPKVRPAIDDLLAKSIERRRSLYQALAR